MCDNRARPCRAAVSLAPNFLLKIVPHVDGTPRICELVEYELADVNLKGAWTGPAALTLSSHALGAACRITGTGNRVRHATPWAGVFFLMGQVDRDVFPLRVALKHAFE